MHTHTVRAHDQAARRRIFEAKKTYTESASYQKVTYTLTPPPSSRAEASCPAPQARPRHSVAAVHLNAVRRMGMALSGYSHGAQGQAALRLRYARHDGVTEASGCTCQHGAAHGLFGVLRVLHHRPPARGERETVKAPRGQREGGPCTRGRHARSPLRA